jgi:exosome complex component RRP42
VPQANGSAVLKCGGTRVLAGIKTELAIPEPDAQNRGSITASVNCSGLASTMFEGRTGEDVSAELTREAP